MRIYTGMIFVVVVVDGGDIEFILLAACCSTTLTHGPFFPPRLPDTMCVHCRKSNEGSSALGQKRIPTNGVDRFFRWGMVIIHFLFCGTFRSAYSRMAAVNDSLLRWDASLLLLSFLSAAERLNG